MSTPSAGYARFIGRASVVADVRARLASARLVTLTGIGGSGKSRIATELFTEYVESDPARSWLIELGDLTDPALIVHVLAAEIGLRVTGAGADAATLTDYLGAAPAFLVIDNCEHLVLEVAQLLAALVQGCPGLTVLCTSQLPLGIAAEVVYSVPPLTEADAVALFVERAQAADAGFELTEVNGPVVAQLVRELDGLPLAVELAAARIRVLDPAALLDRLSDRHAVLGPGFLDRPARQSSMTASVEWSYDLCSPAEQQLWSRLSIFVGGFDLAAVEDVATGLGIERDQVLDLLAALVDRSVVGRIPESGARYRMLETTRQYGLARLRESGEIEHWQRNHLAWYVGVVEEFESTWFGPGQAAWLGRLDAELANLRAALEFAVADPSTAAFALGICYRLQPFWVCTGQLSEARLWAGRGLAHDTGGHVERARTYAMCASIGALQFDVDFAARMIEAGAPHVEAAQDQVVLGYHLFAAALVRTWQLDIEGGIELVERSAEALRGSDDRYGYTRTIGHLGVDLSFRGDLDRGSALQREVLELCDAAGESSMRSNALWALGLDAFAGGDVASAEALFREAVMLSWQLRDRLGIAFRLEAIAWVAAVQGRSEYAATVLGSAAATWKRLHIPADLAPYVLGEGGSDGRLEHRARLEVEEAAAYATGAAFSVEESVRFALESADAAAETALPAQARTSVLTRREIEVADLVAEGLSNREIATKLFLSERTAQGHVQNILRKLDVGSRAQIATWVVREQAG